MGIYTSSGWKKNPISKFKEKSGQKRTKKQLKNKLDNIKKEYTSFMDFKNCATSLGWNEAKQTVDLKGSYRWFKCSSCSANRGSGYRHMSTWIYISEHTCYL